LPLISWEQFEIGAYRSMLGAAEELGMGDLQQMCERFIREEPEMANVFFEQLGSRHKTGRIARWAGPNQERRC